MSECNPHPDAPHGFDRTASHSEDRYVCDCEGWEPPGASPNGSLMSDLQERLINAIIDTLQDGDPFLTIAVGNNIIEITWSQDED